MISVKAIAQLDLNLLKVLEVLYQHQNMTRTAEQLNITPSAVSHSMKRLRDTFEDPLFTRQGSQMLPTPLCRRVMPEIIALLTSLRRTLQTLGTFEPQTAAQVLRLAIHDALEPLILPKILQIFADSAPLLSFHSVKLERDQLAMQFETGAIDFAIDVAQPLSTPIEHTCIASSSFCCLVGAAYFKSESLNTKEYGKSHHITVSNRPTGKVLEDIAFAKLGFNRNIQARCQSYQTAIHLLKQQPSILTLPKSMADSLKDVELKIMPLPFDVPKVETHLYWHAQAKTDSLLNWVQHSLVSGFGSTSLQQ